MAAITRFSHSSHSTANEARENLLIPIRKTIQNGGLPFKLALRALLESGQNPALALKNVLFEMKVPDEIFETPQRLNRYVEIIMRSSNETHSLDEINEALQNLGGKNGELLLQIALRSRESFNHAMKELVDIESSGRRFLLNYLISGVDYDTALTTVKMEKHRMFDTTDRPKAG